MSKDDYLATKHYHVALALGVLTCPLFCVLLILHPDSLVDRLLGALSGWPIHSLTYILLKLGVLVSFSGTPVFAAMASYAYAWRPTLSAVVSVTLVSLVSLLLGCIFISGFNIDITTYTLLSAAGPFACLLLWPLRHKILRMPPAKRFGLHLVVTMLVLTVCVFECGVLIWGG